MAEIAARMTPLRATLLFTMLCAITLTGVETVLGLLSLTVETTIPIRSAVYLLLFSAVCYPLMRSYYRQLNTIDQARKEQEQYLSAILATEPECVKLLDRNGALLMMNPAGLALIQADSLEEARGICIAPLVTEKHRNEYIDLNKQIFAGESATLIFELQGLKGKRVWLESHAVPFKNSAGEIVAQLAITRDITERRRIERALFENSRLLSGLIEHSGMLIAIKDREGRYELINRKWEQVTGLTRTEVIGKNDSELFNPAIAELFKINDLAAIQGDQPLTSEEQLDDPLRGMRYFFSVKFPLKTDEDQLRGICLMATEITDLKQTEQRLRSSEEKYRILFRDSPDAYLILADGVFDDCNRAAETMLRGDRSRIIGRTPAELSPLHQPDGQLSTDAVKRHLDSTYLHGGSCFEWLHRRLDGSDIYVEVLLAVTTLDNRQIVFTALRDITQRKQDEYLLHEQAVMLEDEIAERQKAEEALGELNRSLEDRITATVAELRHKDDLLMHQNRLAAMGELLTSIAHQWRQPLNNIAAYLQSMQFLQHHHELSDEEMDCDISAVMEILQYMSQTIDDFRSFFHKDHHKQEFCINTVIERCLTLLKSGLTARNIQVDISGTEAVRAYGYPNEYAQALMNILNNASDALSERGIASPCIELSVSTSARLATVTVRDNAGGIAPDVMPHIFEPYFSTKGPATGTGIGLHMARTLIERNMHGRLTAQNVADGAEFKLSVPVHEPTEQSAHRVSADDNQAV